jgi:serine protease Do
VDLVGYDARTDLAVLQAKGNRLPSVPLGDSNGLMIGEWVIAIGNPFGVLMKDPQPTVSVGVVSANHRRVSRRIGEGERLYQDMIQTDAAINPGNSGGPLANANGEVIGVNTMIFSPSGGSIGLGFAIPINRVKRVVQEILQYGRRRDPWAGFKVEDVSALRGDLRGDLGIRATTGCVVVSLLSNSPAYQGGLRTGDTILSINGQPVEVSTDLDFGVWSLFDGDPVVLEVDRQGVRKTIQFRIKELPE